uniref:Uncharacterized protein n=1 Tax=Cacopsylla melanoneura TaxID=428564 RepID=A0A8D8TPY2_9HEMI
MMKTKNILTRKRQFPKKKWMWMCQMKGRKNRNLLLNQTKRKRVERKVKMPLKTICLMKKMNPNLPNQRLLARKLPERIRSLNFWETLMKKMKEKIVSTRTGEET